MDRLVELSIRRVRSGPHARRDGSRPYVASRGAGEAGLALVSCAGVKCDAAIAERGAPMASGRRSLSMDGEAHREMQRSPKEGCMSTLPHQRALASVLAAALQVQPDQQLAEEFVRNEPIAAFGGKTLLNLTEEGRAKDAIDYIESIASGFVG